MTKRTSTSAFGTGARNSHDASAFYRRKLETVTLSDSTDLRPLGWYPTNRLFCDTSTNMAAIPDNSVALMVTSPGYHVGKDYDDDGPFEAHLNMLERVFTEAFRVLEPGGRACINIANLGRKPYVYFTDLIVDMCRDIGFLPRGEILWVKAKGAAGSAAFGSYCSPANPVLRDVHEYIEVFSKGRFDRAPKWQERKTAGLPWEPTITKEDFLESTLSVWEMRPESAKRIGHPAPFPIELPRRCIEMFTWKDDVVLDPFMGAGTTAVAAKMTGRRWVGYDTEPSYLATALARLRATNEPTL